MKIFLGIAGIIGGEWMLWRLWEHISVQIFGGIFTASSEEILRKKNPERYCWWILEKPAVFSKEIHGGIIQEIHPWLSKGNLLVISEGIS